MIFKEIDIEDFVFENEKSIRIDERDFDPNRVEEKRKSIGMISRIENFDRNFLQRMLRKEGWEEDEPIFHDEFVEEYQKYDQSLEDRFSATVKRNDRGGDLSLYRNSIMHKKNIPKEVDKSARGQFSMRENFSRRFGKDEFTTPNKNGRHSINFKHDEISALRNNNLLHVAQILNDNHIDYSWSRRKSYRMSYRKSKHDSKSDLSHPRARVDSKGSRHTGNPNISPMYIQAMKNKERERRLSQEEGNNPFKVNNSRGPDDSYDPKLDSKSDKMAKSSDNYFVPDRFMSGITIKHEQLDNNGKHKRL